MRIILFALLACGCSRTAAPVAPPVTTTTAAAATCGMDEPVEIKVEVVKPAKNPLFDRESCR